MACRDESQAYANGRFDTAVKNIMTSSGTCGSFSYPACSAPAWSASGTYPTGSQVTYDSEHEVITLQFGEILTVILSHRLHLAGSLLRFRHALS